MNWLDVLLLVLVAGSTATAFAKGFTRVVIGLISAVAALVLGIWLYGLAGSWLVPFVSSRGVANFCGFVLVFFGVLVVGGIAGLLAGKLMKAAGLSFVDRLMGAGFGVIRGLLMALAVVLALMAFTPGGAPPRAVVESRLSPYVLEAARLTAAVAPHELRTGFRNSYEQVKQVWSKALKHGIRELPRAEKVENEREI
jgi:membrane protein required for colicin V production